MTMNFTESDEPEGQEQPDLGGWDRERDGKMVDYEHVEVGVRIEPYDPAKDPVNKGLVPDPYAGEDGSR